MPKCIGIVDITTVGATICQRALAERDDHPEFICHSFPFKQYKALVTSEDWSGMAGLILESIKKLQAAGADFVIIPSNTPHYAFKSIQAGSPLPLLNLVEITVDECKKRQYKRVAVLGTKQTMEKGLYKEPLAVANITPAIPDQDVREKVNALIYNIINKNETKEEIGVLTQLLKLMECDAYILGCTELPEVFNEGVLGKPCIDTTRLLAYAAVEHAQSLGVVDVDDSGATASFGFGMTK